MEFYDVLEYDFATRWRDRVDQGGAVPNDLLQALREVFGRDPKAELVHWLDAEDDVLFLLVNGDAGHLVRYAAPKTAVSFLGSLLGGHYSENVFAGERAIDRVELQFTHNRLAAPLVVTMRYGAEPGLRPQRQGDSDAWQRTGILREKFRRWATESPQPSDR